MSTTITTRQTAGTGATIKGSPLTNTEADNNFINLNIAVQPAGGTIGQVLSKIDATDFNSQWIDNYSTTLEITVRNETGSTIAKGSVVYISGRSGSTPLIQLARADALSTAQAIGITKTSMANNTNGTLVILGQLDNVNTSGFAPGTTLYLSSTTAGAFTDVKPTAPNYAVRIGFSLYNNVSAGSLFASFRPVFVNAADIIGTVAIANGGTNTTATPTAGALAYGTGTAYSFTAAGTAGYVATSGGVGAPVWTNTPTLVGTNFSGVPNGALTNSSITFGATAQVLGSTVSTLNAVSIGQSTAAAGSFTTLTASSDPSFTSTGAVQLPSGTTAQQPTGVAGKLRFNSTTSQFEGYSGTTWATLSSAVPLGLFSKTNSTVVAWSKTGAGTATAATTIYIDVNGSIKTIASGTSITMPTLVAGTDYAIWCKPDGTLEATSNHVSPPVANSRKVGGFHYAPGGHSGAPGGGNTTPGIWAGSFWDLKWRPNCPDPRGMEYWCGSWMDMYITGVDAITLGSSRYNVTMADGSSPPKVPTIFGGNGSTTYGSYTWFEAAELAMAMGKRLPTQREFMTHAYGTTEASSIGTDQNNTILNAAYTSAAGLFQATGVLWIWGDDRGGAYNTTGWNANTEGRGSEYNAPNAAFLGGAWDNGANAGSRCSAWADAASNSANSIGSRFCCDHLQLD